MKFDVVGLWSDPCAADRPPPALRLVETEVEAIEEPVTAITSDVATRFVDDTARDEPVTVIALGPAASDTLAESA